jgi:hypothetical protein
MTPERRSVWSDNNYSAKLLNFNWDNNGWMIDEAGRQCLRVSNGASVELPLELFTFNNT